MCEAIPRGQIGSHGLDFQIQLIRALLKALYLFCAVLCTSRSFQFLHTCDIFLISSPTSSVEACCASTKIPGSCGSSGDELSSHLSLSVLLRTVKWGLHKRKGKYLGGKAFFSMVGVAFRVVCDTGVKKKWKEGLVISGRERKT